MADIKKETKLLQQFKGKQGSFFVMLSKPVLELAMGWQKNQPIEIEYDPNQERVIVSRAKPAEAAQA